MDFEIISMLLFFALIGLMLWKDRKKVDFHGGIVIRRMYSSRRALDHMVGKHKKFFNVLGNIAVVAAIATAVIGTGFLIVFPILFQAKSFAIVLPTVSSYQYPGPIISIPIWYWLIAVFIIMVCHETMHAVMSRLEGVRIQNYGVIFLLLLPIGAFVDPDMKKVAKLKLMGRLRIYAAGSFGNYIAAGVIILLFFSSAWSTGRLIEDVGVKFTGTTVNTPANDVGLNGFIKEINGTTIKNRADLQKVLDAIEPGSRIEIVTTEGRFVLTTMENPYNTGKSYLGIENVREAYKFLVGPLPGQYVPDIIIDMMFVWYSLLSWLFMLSTGVAIVNLLPMKPLDGGYIFEEIARDKLGGHAKIATRAATIFIAILLLLNLFAFDLIKFLLSIF